MSTTRYATLLGLVLGGIWGLVDFPAALLAGALAAIGYVIALVMEGRISLDTDALGRGDRGKT